MHNPRHWFFVADMNYSGSVTISDCWLWFEWLYFWPGDMFVYIMMNALPSIAHFFEITHGNYGGIFAGIISFIFWTLWITGVVTKFKTTN